MKKGFDRLRGVAAASAVGLSVLGAGLGTVRAAPVTTGSSYKITLGANNSIIWGGSSPSSTNTSGLGNITWIGPNETTASGFAVKSASSVTNTGVANFTNFGIADAGLNGVNALTTASASAATTAAANLNDAFDQAMTMAVDGFLYANPTATPDLTDGLLSGGNMADIVSGLDAQASLYFPPTRAVARAFYTVTNTTGADIATTVTVMGNMGSDSSTVIEASSNGDTTNDVADLWVVSSESAQGFDAVDGNDPIITTTRYGTGAAVMPTLGADLLGVSNSDNYYHHYAVTVPANDSVSIMMFHEMTNTIASASTGAADFETLEAANTANLLTGLSDSQLSKLVNYAAAAPVVVPDVAITPTAASDDDDGLLGMGLPGLLAMLGMLPVLRLFRKTKD